MLKEGGFKTFTKSLPCLDTKHTPMFRNSGTVVVSGDGEVEPVLLIVEGVEDFVDAGRIIGLLSVRVLKWLTCCTGI